MTREGESTPLPEAVQRGGTDKATLIAEEAALMAEEEAQALTHGIDVRGLRAATVIRYSTSSHPLQAAVVHCLRLVARGTEDDTALLEALLRGPLYIVGGALLALGAVVVCVARGRDGGGGKVARNAVDFLREGCLFLAAALSLLLPGAAALIYRNMPLDDGDWDLRPLPTPLGAVDPRRFWAFYLGRCALANNGYYDPGLGSLDWPWTGAVLHPARGDQDAAALGFDAPAAVT